jgi:hypothetical protein
LSLIRGTVWPTFNTKTVLLVFKPLPFVATAINMSINASSVGFVIFPFTFIYISVSMN